MEDSLEAVRPEIRNSSRPTSPENPQRGGFLQRLRDKLGTKKALEDLAGQGGISTEKGQGDPVETFFRSPEFKKRVEIATQPTSSEDPKRAEDLAVYIRGLDSGFRSGRNPDAIRRLVALPDIQADFIKKVDYIVGDGAYVDYLSADVLSYPRADGTNPRVSIATHKTDVDGLYRGTITLHRGKPEAYDTLFELSEEERERIEDTTRRQAANKKAGESGSILHQEWAKSVNRYSQSQRDLCNRQLRSVGLSDIRL